MEQTGELRQSKLSVFRNRPEFTAIIILVSFYLFISNYFVWGQAFVGGVVNTSGGSDPYYNFRIIQYILTYHHALLHDPALNYPLGANNPRPPFFYFLTVLAAIIISPAVGGIANGAYYFFNEVDALFGALLIIPVYLIANQVFGKRAGIVAAALYTLMPSNLSAGILTDGRLHTPELLFGFLAVYFFQRAIGTISKGKIVDDLWKVRTYIPSIRKFITDNRLSTIYGLLSGASLGGLILSWQGYPYIEVIILLYVVVQLVVNVISKVPTGHLTYLVILFLSLGFAIGAYPYYALGFGYMHQWLIQPLEIGLAILGLSIIFNIFGRRPWIITIPSIAIIAVIGVVVIGHFAPGVIKAVVTGQGYFVKNRLYSTIAEASSPQLGQYISGFGAGQFVLGMAGVGYLIYLYTKRRTETYLFLLVFSVVSIYMSFAAARFNITAAPAYAALGAGLLVYFADTSRLSEMKKRRVVSEGSVKQSVKGNISWLHAVTSVFIVILLIVPAGFAMVSAAVPANTAQQVDKQIMNTIPPALRFGNTSQGPVFVGGYGFSITNNSAPFSQSMSWLTNQDKNQPMNQRPAYVSWWDYGFQEMYQGQHPAVADDFQQGYQIAGQILMAQNDSQVISLFISRIIQGDFQKNGNSFSPAINSTLKQYFGIQEEQLLSKISANPGNYISWIQNNSSVYGKFISAISNANAYYALVKGQLSSKYSLETINSAYVALERASGYSIKYVQIPSGLFPQSGLNPGIFYAPAYLIDSPSYTSTGGQVVPTNYYQVYAITANGTFPLNNVPKGVQPLNYSISYTPAFYNTSIYRFTMGYPPYVNGKTNGIPGVTYGQGQYQIMPAWNMSNFEITYEGIPWNPYTDYQNHTNAWKIIPLQQAYTYQHEGKGIAEIFPPPSQIVPAGQPIVSYYPGAKLTGQITLPGGQPAPGIRVTVFDQYGIPHQTVLTNSNGYYNLTGLPGNDTLVITTGKLNQNFLIGQNSIKNIKVYVSQNQANRLVTGYNNTTGQPSYVIGNNYVLANNSVSGYVRSQYQTSKNISKLHPFSQPLVNTGKVELHNSTYNMTYTLNITDGQYSAKNILPFSFRATVLSGGNTYSNVSWVNMSNGATQVDDLFIQYDTLFLNVTGPGGNNLPGYNVYAVGANGKEYSNITNSTGQTLVWVTPGNYTVYAENNYSVTPLSREYFSDWNQNVSLNLTPQVSASVSGRINGAGSGVNVKFLVNGYLSKSYSVTTSAGGYYQTELPYGVYTAYVNESGQVALKTFTLNSPKTVNLSLSYALELTLGSTLKKLNLYTGYFQILGSSALLQFNFSKQTTTSIMLPSGTYSIAGASSYLGTTYSAFTHINLAGSRSINLSLVANSHFSLFAYDKSIVNGYSAKSAINRGLVTLYESNVPVMYTVIGKQGFAQLEYASNNASSYSLHFQSGYYSAGSLSYSGSSTIYYPVSPQNGLLSITLKPAIGYGSVSGTFTLKGMHEYNFTIIRNSLSASILPGVYYGSISGSQTLSIPQSPVYVVTSTGSSYKSTIMQFASVSVAGATSFHLYNKTGSVALNNSKVPVGIYTVYATNGSRALIYTANITSNTTIKQPFSQGYTLKLENSLSITGGRYTVSTGGNDKLNLTYGNWTLPSSSYAVAYSNAYSNKTGSYYLSGSSTVSLTSQTILNMSLNSVKSNTGLFGTAMFSGSPSQYTLIEALNSRGLIVNTTRTNSAGYYNMTLPQGTYTIYALNNASLQGYFQSETIAPFSGYNQYNLSMRQGYKTYISVNVNSKLLYTNVTISIGSKKILVNSTYSGPYVLPQGNYTFSAGITETESVYNGTTIQVSYGTNYTTDINKNSYVTVTLQKTKIYSFVTTQTSKVQTVSNNGTFDATFTILNSGNSMVNVTLSSGSYFWKMDFNRTTLDIHPGQKVNISASVTAQNNPPAGRNQIPVVMSYSGQKSDGYLSANVTANSSFSLSKGSTLAIVNGSKVWIPITISNTGNKAVTVNFSVTSQSLTVLKAYNWNSSLYANGVLTSKILVPYNTSVTVYAVLAPATAGQASPVTFNMNFNSTSEGKSLSLSTSVPSISSISTYPVGSGIMGNYTGNPYSAIEYGLIMIALIVAAGLIASGIRTRNRRGKK